MTTISAGIPVLDRHPGRSVRRRRTGHSAMFVRLACIAAAIGVFAAAPQVVSLLPTSAVASQPAR